MKTGLNCLLHENNLNHGFDGGGLGGWYRNCLRDQVSPVLDSGKCLNNKLEQEHMRRRTTLFIENTSRLSITSSSGLRDPPGTSRRRQKPKLHMKPRSRSRLNKEPHAMETRRSRATRGRGEQRDPKSVSLQGLKTAEAYTPLAHGNVDDYSPCACARPRQRLRSTLPEAHERFAQQTSEAAITLQGTP